MTNHEEPSASGPYEKDGRAWRIGTQDDVSWIQQGLTPGTAITTAIPPEFETYARLLSARVIPATGSRPTRIRPSSMSWKRIPTPNRGGSATWKRAPATWCSPKRRGSSCTGIGAT